MTKICPYCKGKMADPPPGTGLSVKRAKVYEAIAAAGIQGVPIKVLKAGLFMGRSSTTIRSTIHHINQAIKPAKIRARNKAYFIQG